MSAPDLTVAIVSYESREALLECLRAIPAAAGSRTCEVIVVDNGSRDGGVDAVRESFPGVTIEDARENLGFSRALNRALARASGRTWIWLNPDARPAAGSLDALATYLEQHPEAGVAGPRIVYPDGRPQPSSQPFPGLVRVLVHLTGISRLARVGWIRRLGARVGPKEARDYARALDPDAATMSVDWISGACLATRAEVARRIGPLDEGYFLYCEDTDWCHRVHAAGLEVHRIASAEVVHEVGGSGGRAPSAVVHYYTSMLRYFRIHRASQFGAIRLAMWLAFVVRGIGSAPARLTGRAGVPWWSLASRCWQAPAGGGTR